MQWDSLQAFIDMGGYGLYVWGAWGGALLLMAGESLLAARAHRRAQRDEDAAEDTR